jgi:hypothetical protein
LNAKFSISQLEAISKMHLKGDIESFELACIILPIHIDFIHTGHSRPLLTPTESSSNRLMITFKDSFDRTVGSVANPATDAEPFGGALGFHSKKYPLNPSGYDGMDSGLFFHVYLLALGTTQRKPIVLITQQFFKPRFINDFYPEFFGFVEL